MSNILPKSVRQLIEELSKLPGVGPKSAQRIAMHLLHSPSSRTQPLGEAILNLKENVVFCTKCWNIGEENPCMICCNESRDQSVICVVEEILDVVAIEKTGEFKGMYHVLHGALSPVDGIGPEQLKFVELFRRAEDGEVKEIILATNPSLEGEATALYIQKHLLNAAVRVTRIARGLPVGGDVEYADSITLTRALAGRAEF
ncbi:recombination protein RecR [Candidatus Peregrinibacteria bacterium CG10_big_fil_rev_8_21_14_0_10_36_19]|nr:MAG: recombination protein RecR [Candidatus Peregrinibacteria bacterium CG10_big_fil_rev_8_21_14_0_10_36_19]